MFKKHKSFLPVLGVAIIIIIFFIYLNNRSTEISPNEYKCLSKFSVNRNDAFPTTKSGKSKLSLFQSFNDGAFFGKIDNYQSGQAKEFASLIEELMKDQKISTFEHFSADICLFRQDLNNPEGGATLDYYVEHHYCTNECSTGTYTLKVDLKDDGYFVGYRRDFKW